MIEDIRNIKSEKRDLIKFGITIGIILVTIAGFLFWKEKESFQIFLGIGIFLFLSAIALPVVLKPVYWIWMVFASILGWIMTRLILSLLFYIIFTSIGLTSRLLGKQFLELRGDKSKSTYWNYKIAKQLIKKDYEKQF